MTALRWRRALTAVVVIEAFCFAFAALLHTGVHIAFLPDFFHDPRIVGATVVEGLCASVLGVAAIFLGGGHPRGWPLAVGAVSFSIVADIFGMAVIALGVGPDSPFNFLFHRIGITVLVITLVLLLAPARAALRIPAGGQSRLPSRY
jgi:hypothetical protein